MSKRISVRDLADLAAHWTADSPLICYNVCKAVYLYSSRGSVEVSNVVLVFETYIEHMLTASPYTQNNLTRFIERIKEL